MGVFREIRDGQRRHNPMKSSRGHLSPTSPSSPSSSGALLCIPSSYVRNSTMHLPSHYLLPVIFFLPTMALMSPTPDDGPPRAVQRKEKLYCVPWDCDERCSRDVYDLYRTMMVSHGYLPISYIVRNPIFLPKPFAKVQSQTPISSHSIGMWPW